MDQDDDRLAACADVGIYGATTVAEHAKQKEA
jgi:hypothetical protein